MYHKAYGIIETLAPLHVGASAGEETGNLNLIFRDQFTQTGIIPGSSIRGRFRADMRLKRLDLDTNKGTASVNINEIDENYWYGHEAVEGQKDSGTTEALVKFEYASLLWIPVFCPGQPIVWVSCPRFLKRYQQITGKPIMTNDQSEPVPDNPKKPKLAQIPKPYTASNNIPAREVEKEEDGNKKKIKVLFFNLGFLEIEHSAKLSGWIPAGVNLPSDKLLVVADNDIEMIHDMALYRQSRSKLQDTMKKVENFFGVEALPEGSILVFPLATKQLGWKTSLLNTDWDNTEQNPTKELYFGGLESIGFGRCNVSLAGEAVNQSQLPTETNLEEE